MTLPVSGSSISLNQVNVELGLSGTTSINMNQATVRTLFAIASGAIAMSNGFGKSNAPVVTSIAIAGTDNYNYNTMATAAWTVTITYSYGPSSTNCTLLTWQQYTAAGIYIDPAIYTNLATVVVTTSNVTLNTAGKAPGSSGGTGALVYGYMKAIHVSTGVFGTLPLAWNCLPLSTLITMSNGTQQKMGEISIGDIVKAIDPKTGDISYERVTFVLDSNKSYDLIKIECENSIILEPTPEHEVWIKRDGVTLWVESKDVVINDELLADDLTYKKVISVEPINYPDGIEVGNISVANAKVYFAERLLMHNTG